MRSRFWHSVGGGTSFGFVFSVGPQPPIHAHPRTNTTAAADRKGATMTASLKDASELPNRTDTCLYPRHQGRVKENPEFVRVARSCPKTIEFAIFSFFGPHFGKPALA